MTPETQQILWNFYLYRTALLLTGAFSVVSFAAMVATVGVVIDAALAVATKADGANPKRVARFAAAFVCLIALTCVLVSAAMTVAAADTLAERALVQEIDRSSGCEGDAPHEPPGAEP
jgi:hypothetical protein